MDITTQQRILYALAGSCLLGAAAAVVWSTSAVDESDSVSTRTSERIVVAKDDPQSARHVIDSSLAGSLRGPLYDPPATAPISKVPTAPVPKPSSTKPLLNLTLVGTIISSGQSLAIVADASGEFDVKGIGESLELSPEGVRIQQIEAEQITLQYMGNESTIRLETNEPPEGNAGRRVNNRRRNP